MMPRLSTCTKRAPGAFLLCCHAADAPCDSGELPLILPAEESLSSTRCARKNGSSECLRQHTPTQVHQRGFQERVPINYPAHEIKLLCGERRQREKKGCIHLGVLLSLTSVAANVVGPPTTRVRLCLDPAQAFRRNQARGRGRGRSGFTKFTCLSSPRTQLSFLWVHRWIAHADHQKFSHQTMVLRHGCGVALGSFRKPRLPRGVAQHALLILLQ